LRIHVVFGLAFLVIVVFSLMSIVIECSPSDTRIYSDPPNYIFDSCTVSIGYKFNVTLRVDKVADLVAWQMKMYYNDSIINVTQWFEPVWDHEYVFYGNKTFTAPTPPDCAYNHVGPGNGSIQVGAILIPLPPDQTPFSGSGKLCILEFIVTAIPSKNEKLSCALSINNPLTYLLDTKGSIIPNVTKEDGYYELRACMYTLTITTTSGGTTKPLPGKYSYSAGTQVEVLAIPDTNNLFDHWKLDGKNAGTINPIKVLMNSNHTLQAIFKLLTHNLTITTTAGGTTNPKPGNYTHANGTVVSVTAIPDASYVFDHWERDGSNIGSKNPIDIIMDANHTVLAVFALRKYTLIITSTAGGNTNPTPGTRNYTVGSSVIVTAIPSLSYSFDHWLLDGEQRKENPITVQMDKNHTLHAVFTLITYELTITITEGGTTAPSPGKYTHANGTAVSVTSIPYTGYEFAYWQLNGTNVGSDNLIEILIHSNCSLRAVFNPVLYYLSIHSVERPSGTTDPSAGTRSHVAGATLNVTALPDPGFSFDYWLLDGKKGVENPITMVMNMNHTLTPYFVDDVPPEIGAPLQEPPENVLAFQNVTVTVNVTDLGMGVKNVTLRYSINNGTTWTSLTMTKITTNTYQTTIPGHEDCTWVEYRIIAFDNIGNQATSEDYRYHIYAYVRVTKLNQSIAFIVGALIIIISGVFLCAYSLVSSKKRLTAMRNQSI